MNLQTIQTLIIDSLKEYNQELQSKELQNPTIDTRLYGSSSALDSLGLVYIVSDLEDKIYQNFGKSIVLADERAMSQKTSPFRSVETLANYIQNLLEEHNG